MLTGWKTETAAKYNNFYLKFKHLIFTLYSKCSIINFYGFLYEVNISMLVENENFFSICIMIINNIGVPGIPTAVIYKYTAENQKINSFSTVNVIVGYSLCSGTEKQNRRWFTTPTDFLH